MRIYGGPTVPKPVCKNVFQDQTPKDSTDSVLHLFLIIQTLSFISL